jgi:hypothetical protein
MVLSARKSRRGVVALVLSAVALKFAPAARAQTAGCQMGFVNGLLTGAGDDCQLFRPPGLSGAQISAPSHLAGAIVTDDAADDAAATAQTDAEIAAERRQRRRDQHRDKKDNNQDHKQDKRARKEDHKEDKRDRRITCEDFDDQKEAIEWLAQHVDDGDALDPDGDGVACEHLDTVRCSDFSTSPDVVA